MRGIPPKSDSFDSLVLPGKHKEIVKALVQMHSQAPDTPQVNSDRQLDLVRGKGGCHNTDVHTTPSTLFMPPLLDRVGLCAKVEPEEPGDESGRGPI